MKFKTRLVLCVFPVLFATNASTADPVQQLAISSIGSERATSGAGGKIVTFEGKTHVVWQDATDGGAYLNQVRTLDHATGEWSETVTLNRGRDNHARPVVTIDRQGFLHVILSGHNSPVHYRRSVRPNDSSAWTTAEAVGSGTYPSIVVNDKDTLHLTLRNPNRWNGVDLHRKLRDGKWQKLRHIVMRDPKLKGYGAFQNGLAWGPEFKTLHTVQDFYESEHTHNQRGVHQAVCYMRSRDAGETWQKADGTNVDLPARPEQMDVLAQHRAPQDRALPPPVVLAQGNIVVDADDRPHILYISHLEEAGRVVHATTGKAGRWRQRAISELVTAYPNHRPIGCRGAMSIDSGGNLYALLELVAYPEGWQGDRPTREMKFAVAGKRLVWLISHDGGEHFEVSPALGESAEFNQPSAERPHGFNRLSAGSFPPFIYFDGESRYRKKGEVLQNHVFLVRPQQ